MHEYFVNLGGLYKLLNTLKLKQRLKSPVSAEIIAENIAISYNSKTLFKDQVGMQYAYCRFSTYCSGYLADLWDFKKLAYSERKFL